MQLEPDFVDQRVFPRIPARCPLLYRVEGSARRMVGISTDFSATGVKMVCKEALPLQAAIEVEFKPGTDKAVPPMLARGQVVRCESDGEGGFLIACRFTRVQALQRA